MSGVFYVHVYYRGFFYHIFSINTPSFFISLILLTMPIFYDINSPETTFINYLFAAQKKEPNLNKNKFFNFLFCYQMLLTASLIYFMFYILHSAMTWGKMHSNTKKK